MRGRAGLDFACDRGIVHDCFKVPFDVWSLQGVEGQITCACIDSFAFCCHSCVGLGFPATVVLVWIESPGVVALAADARGWFDWLAGMLCST